MKRFIETTSEAANKKGRLCSSEASMGVSAVGLIAAAREMRHEVAFTGHTTVDGLWRLSGMVRLAIERRDGCRCHDALCAEGRESRQS